MAVRHQFGGVYWTFQPGPNKEKRVQLDAARATMNLWEFEELLVTMLRSLQDQKDWEQNGVGLRARASPEAG